MAQTTTRQNGKGVVELLEEAAHLLRLAPPGALAAYAVGSLPFVLAVLYFWADMSRSAFARDHLAAGSMGLAGLFVWMKCWHAVFMRKLLAALCGEAPPAWPIRRVLRLVVAQAVIQPWGLLAVAASAVAVLPFPWAYAFWQSACLNADGRENAPLRQTLAASWRQAAVWTRQNVVALLVLGLLGVFVFINIAQAILTPSFLLKKFLGVDTVFTRGGFTALNTTFLAIAGGLTYLCLDPLVKSFYTLRCFYSRSRRTGQDLQAELRGLVSAKGAVVAALVAAAGILAACPSPARASTGPAASVLAAAGTADAGAAPAPEASPAGEGVSPEELDRSVGRVIGRREYAWRMPREREAESESASWLDSVSNKIDEWVEKLMDGLFGDKEPKRRREAPPPRSRGSGGSAWLAVLRPLIYVLLGVAVVVLLALVWHAYRKRGREPAKEAAKAAAAAPDLEDENIAPDELPERGWLELAREMLQKGDRRLALRAMYLASLSLLGARGMIATARFKSNGDYRRELQRRAHALPDLVAAFGQNVGFFEDSWYGLHDVTGEVVDGFLANQERIRRSDEG